MILALNVGSSSLKFALFDVSDVETILASGIVSRIGQPDSQIVLEADGQQSAHGLAVQTHDVAATKIFEWLGPRLDADPGFVLAHRVVHGGRMSNHAVISPEVESRIEDACLLAPLHNPPALAVIRRARDLIGPKTPMIAVFDTAFFAGLPEVASRYAIPWAISERHSIRRYGFHGLAHEWMMNASAQALHRTPEDMNLISLQIGNGCSAALVVNGRAIDSSMGMTPLEGLMMGTRSGSIDPAIVALLADRERISPGAVIDILNFESGLKGVSGISSDWRDIEAAAVRGDQRATIAMEMFAYRIRKQIGAYVAVAPGGVDAIVFGGGIGEHSPVLRQMAVGGLGHLGIQLDSRRNETPTERGTRIVSELDSQTQIVVTQVDEMRVVAEVAAETVKRHS